MLQENAELVAIKNVNSLFKATQSSKTQNKFAFNMQL